MTRLTKNAFARINIPRQTQARITKESQEEVPMEQQDNDLPEEKEAVPLEPIAKTDPVFETEMPVGIAIYLQEDY